MTLEIQNWKAAWALGCSSPLAHSAGGNPGVFLIPCWAFSSSPHKPWFHLPDELFCLGPVSSFVAGSWSLRSRDWASGKDKGMRVAVRALWPSLLSPKWGRAPVPPCPLPRVVQTPVTFLVSQRGVGNDSGWFSASWHSLLSLSFQSYDLISQTWSAQGWGMNFPANPGLGTTLPQITHGQKDPLDLASILASLLPKP